MILFFGTIMDLFFVAEINMFEYLRFKLPIMNNSFYQKLFVTSFSLLLPS